jgi:heme exporter protein C
MPNRRAERPHRDVQPVPQLPQTLARTQNGTQINDMNTTAQKLANPTRFMALSGALLPWIAGAAVIVLTYGLYLSFFSAPPDSVQGQTVKIMFVHVPSAWLAMGIYLLVASSSFGLLVFRHPLADVSAKAAVPIGAAFTFLALVTGALWGRPMWGAYWVWDARLTSVLILFFLYLGLMALRSSLDDETLAAKLTAILGLVGVVLLPVIKFSVEWLNTLHQPASVLRSGGLAIHSSILIPLLVMAGGFLLAFIAMHLMAMRNEVLRRRARALTLSHVSRADTGVPAAAKG